MRIRASCILILFVKVWQSGGVINDKLCIFVPTILKFFFMGMYLRISVVFLFLAATLLFISCNQRSGRGIPKAENNIGFDTVSMQERHHLDGDTTNPYCNIEIAFIYPVSSPKSDLAILQQFFILNTFGVPYDTLAPTKAVHAYVKNYIDNYKADAKTYKETANEIEELNNLISNLDVLDKEHYEETYFYSYYEKLSDSIVYNRHGILSFQVILSNNKGGAASYDLFRNYVLNLQTGKQVTESDIFHAGYESTLQRIIIASLLDQAKVKSVEELEELGFFGIYEIVPNSNFLLNEKGIIYTYNKGEYSAYQLDAPVVFIPYEEILTLIKENSVASKLAKL